MPDQPILSELVPHRGRMCLLGGVSAWSETAITCHAVSHLDPANPLRRAGRLAALCGIEYGMQAAAAHGGLTADAGSGPPGYLAAIRAVDLHVPWLDEARFGTLAVTATLLLRASQGWIYGFALHAADGTPLVAGRGTIVMPPGIMPGGLGA